jgi:hypothetical protein
LEGEYDGIGSVVDVKGLTLCKFHQISSPILQQNRRTETGDYGMEVMED